MRCYSSAQCDFGARRRRKPYGKQQPLPPAEIEALKGLHPVTATDLQESLACTNRSYASQYYRRYDEWAQQYGSV